MAASSGLRHLGYAHTDESTWSDDDFVVPDDELLSSQDEEQDLWHPPGSPSSRPGSDRAIKHLYHPSAEKDFSEGVETARQIFGRENEIQRIQRVVGCRPGATRPILVGPRGIGKKAIVKGLAASIKAGKCYPHLKEHRVVMINANSLFHLPDGVKGSSSADKLRGIFRRHLGETDGKCIFYLRDIDRMLKDGDVKKYLLGIFQKPLAIIGSVMSSSDGDSAMAMKAVLGPYKFELWKVPQLPPKEVFNILRDRLGDVKYSGGARFAPTVVKQIVELSHRYLQSQPEPVQSMQVAFEAGNMASLEVMGQSRRQVPTVTTKHAAELVAKKADLPLSRLQLSDWQFLDSIKPYFNQRVIGQEPAVKIVSKILKQRWLGLRSSKCPWASFLFVGPTGVGKTLMSTLMGPLLFNDDDSFVFIDGSEYKEDYTVSKLLGSPKGYEGSESGWLTEQLGKRKHGVLLVDELEKMHADVRQILLQVMDRGAITDRSGKTVDCRGWIIICTSNIAAEKLYANPTLSSEIVDEITAELSPEFCGRLTAMIPFDRLQDDRIPEVIEVQLQELAKQHSSSDEPFHLTWTPDVVPFLGKQPVDCRFGHRGLCKWLDQTVHHALAKAAQDARKLLEGHDLILSVQSHRLVANFKETRTHSRKRQRR